MSKFTPGVSGNKRGRPPKDPGRDNLLILARAKLAELLREPGITEKQIKAATSLVVADEKRFKKLEVDSHNTFSNPEEQKMIMDLLNDEQVNTSPSSRQIST